MKSNKRTIRSLAATNDDAQDKRFKQEDKTTASSISYTSTEEEADAKLEKLDNMSPVLRLNLPPQSCTVPDISLGHLGRSQNSLLETMLHPLKPSSFLKHCFRKKAIHIQSNNSQRARDIVKDNMFGLDTKKIFQETSSDSIFLWIPQKEKDEGGVENKTLQSIELADPDTAHLLHKHSHYASYCRAPPELEQPLVGHMLTDIGLGLGQYDPTGTKITTLGRGEVETFVGTRGHITDWHTDFQENFTIQLSGSKRWVLKQGTVIHPIRGTTPHYKCTQDVIENQLKVARLSNPKTQFGRQNLEANAHGEEVEIIMNAGDVLYFPAGMWHKVETLEYGVSINISLMGSTYASIVCRSLEHLLLKKDHWREVICGGVSDSVSGSGGVIQRLEELLKELPHIISDFRQNNGAMAILPPVMRQKYSYEVIREEEEICKHQEPLQQEYGDGKYVDADDVRTCIDSDVSSKLFNQSIEESGQNNDIDSIDSDEGGEMAEEIIDVEDFEYPDSVELKRSQDGFNSYLKNPLASLMRMKDIQPSKSTTVQSVDVNETDLDGDGNNSDSESIMHLFILNVNFAGNDMHESSVRVKLCDRSGQLETFCKLEEGSLVCDEISWKEHVPKPYAALMYYGYLSWKHT